MFSSPDSPHARKRLGQPKGGATLTCAQGYTPCLSTREILRQILNEGEGSAAFCAMHPHDTFSSPPHHLPVTHTWGAFPGDTFCT